MLDSFRSISTAEKLKKVAYGIIVLFLILLTGIQSGQIIYKYVQEPTYITTKYNTQGTSLIPSISICPDLIDDVSMHRAKTI